ncbi:MAG: prephenate dehydrogenase [Actinomycetes bacterium]
MTPSLQIVGAGLLGTSVGLALAHSEWKVWVADTDRAAERLAAELGGGTAGWVGAQPDVVLLCVPPSATSEVMSHVVRLYPSATISDVLSVKTYPQVEAEKLGCAARFVGGHPMAGRERSGPVAAQADLFEARPWAVCAGSSAEPHRVALIERLARDCGADPLLIDAAAHDEAVALVSHLPQLAASAVAGQLKNADPLALVLAGQGLRDTVRIAGSDPRLWSDIVTANARALALPVRRLATDLSAIADAIEEAAGGKFGTEESRDVDKAIERFLDSGQQGFALIPGKHGAPAADYTVIPVVIPDEPGALARLFTTVARAGASVEDISLEHSPGHPVGVIELAVVPAEAPALVQALHSDGWSSH